MIEIKAKDIIKESLTSHEDDPKAVLIYVRLRTKPNERWIAAFEAGARGWAWVREYNKEPAILLSYRGSLDDAFDPLVQIVDNVSNTEYDREREQTARLESAKRDLTKFLQSWGIES